LKALVSALVLLCLFAGLVACGSSDSTDTAAEEAQAAKLEELQLEKEAAEQEAKQAQAEAEKEVRAAKKAAAKKKAASESAPEPEPAPEPEEVPDVVGMRLPEAESTLSAAGYTTEPENTDTTFGIVVSSHYTVCEQSEPHGSVVNVLAQKYGC
jgi:PASTA domain